MRILMFFLCALATPVIAIDWAKQAESDAAQDKTAIIFDGKAPDRLVCDTTLRAMPDGSWVMVMLGGGHTEPLPANRVFLSRSLDKGKTWSAMRPVDLGVKARDPNASLVPSELMVMGDRCTMFVATHNGTFKNWKEWVTHSDDSCRTWSPLKPAPGRLHDRTFIRNHIVTRDGRILLPFQHFLKVGRTRKISKNRLFSPPQNPRNGVLMSSDGGKTWEEHGDIRISKDDNYHGWAENNIIELSNGNIAMIIRADRLGGVLYYAESKDGGRTWPEFAVKTKIPNPGSKATLYPLGGDTVAILHNPNTKHRSPLALWISFDGMKTWPYRRVLVTESCDGPKGRLNYPDGFVSSDKQYLHFAFDDNRHRAVYVGARLPSQHLSKEDSHRETVPPFYKDRSELLHWLDDAGKSHPITRPEDWQHRRAHILANMSRVMGPLPKRDGSNLEVKVVSSERLATLTRKKITYLSSKGDRVPAYLLIPHDIRQPRPAMLCLHGTSGPRGRTAGVGKPYPTYTLELARRGYVTIAPDYTLLGENQTHPATLGYVSGTMKGIFNHMRAVDLLASLPEVDADRIGCCGLSLGGHNALFVGAFDPRMKIVVTSSGFDSFLDYMDGNPTGWCQTRYMPRIETVFQKDPQRIPFDFPEVLAAIAPRRLYVHAPQDDTNFKVDSARRCVDAARRVYRLLKSETNLKAVYPPGPHGFPPEEREAAYRYIDQALNWTPPQK